MHWTVGLGTIVKSLHCDLGVMGSNVGVSLHTSPSQTLSDERLMQWDAFFLVECIEHF